MKGKIFKSKDTSGKMSSTKVFVDENDGSLFIIQRLFIDENIINEGWKIIRQTKHYILAERHVFISINSLRDIMSIFHEFATEFKLFEKFPELLSEIIINNQD